MGLCVAMGKPFLGRRTQKAGVLYLALEDSMHRVWKRIERMLGKGPVPEEFRIAVESTRLDTGLLGRLLREKEERPDLGLIIIDTFQKVRPPRNGLAKTDYEIDYKVLGEIVDFTHLFDDLTVLLIHHNRKSNSEDADPFDSINGSVAIQGAVDTMWVLRYPRKKGAEKVLFTTGRDIPGEEIVIDFDESRRWRAIGSVEDVESQRIRKEYETSPVVITLKSILDQLCNDPNAPIKEYVARPKDFRQEVIQRTAQTVGTSERMFQEIVNKFDGLLFEDGIEHLYPDRSTKFINADGAQASGRFHRYRYTKHSDISTHGE